MRTSPRQGRLWPHLRIGEEFGMEHRGRGERGKQRMAEKAVIYTRVSTEEQVKGGTSLSGQKAACEEYCERQGYKVAKSFVEEGESAKTANRTELKALLTYCREAKDIKAV